MDRTFAADRRTLTRLLAGASVTALSGCTNLRIEPNPASGVRAVTKFTLGGHAGAWVGIAPEQIREERNPMLRMPPSTTIELTWKNLDGKPHRFVIEDSRGRTLVESAESSKKGATRTVTFESAQEMTTYLDPGFSVQMRGEILVSTN